MYLNLAGSHRWKSGKNRENKKKEGRKGGIGRENMHELRSLPCSGGDRCGDGEERKARGSIP